MMVHAEQIVALCLAQAGDRYVFGAEVSFADPNPTTFDCSEIVEWSCARNGVTPTMPDGSWLQWRHARNHDTLTTIDAAIRQRGALLFRFSSDPGTGNRPSTAHVAVSLGNGTTIEARGSKWGVNIFPSTARGWTHAARIPGVSYDIIAVEAPRPAAEEPVDLESLKLVLKAALIELMTEDTEGAKKFRKALADTITANIPTPA
jgi:cell wall-associated NlpC family hydrolase